MKILKIKLENFASHLNSCIDLTEIVSATVSGKNGSGKSTAFVDAPLWALFGKCRAEPDVIMSHDQVRMSVSISFSLDGQVYRVERTRSRQTKAGKTELTFMAWGDNSWTPIGGHKITETQEAIKQVLNADYELCANSNFLIQGKADKFSTAGPAERKAILAQVLKLDEYSLLRTSANKKTAQTLSAISEITTQLTPTQALADLVFGITEMIRAAELDMERCSASQIDFNARLKAHYEEFAKKEAALKIIAEAKKGLGDLYREQEELLMQLNRNKMDQGYYEALISRKDEIEQKAQEHEKLKETFEKNREWESSTTKMFLSLEGEIQALLERKAREDETLGRVKGELQRLEHKKELIMNQREIQLGQIQSEIGQDINQGKLLEVVPCFIELQQKCRFTIEAVAALEGLPAKKTKLFILEHRNFLSEQLPDYEKDYQTRLDQIAALEVTPTNEKLDTLRSHRQGMVLNQGVMTKDLEALKDQMREIYPSAKLKPELETVLKEVEKLTEVAKSKQELLHKINNDITIKECNAMDEKSLKEWMNMSGQQLHSLQTKEAFFNGEMQGITEKLGSLRQQKVQSVAAVETAYELNQRLTDAQAKHEGYTRLYNYYTTIPVMIMEGAVPTLEAATNSILEKISPSGMRIRLITQKALKSSDKIGETLDILVRDVFGEKPYENYSGGEKFRLDLALRFGLSQLLMHRAGSKMETLIIDEGLGSLDQDGLALLRECLSKLETSFGLILVISHVDGIQGTFEQEIHVEKNAIGSEIKVL